MNDNEKDGNSYGHVLKYTGIFGGVQGLNILMGLVRNKLVAVILGPAGMGLVSLFNTAANFVSQATNLGLSFSAIRNLSELFDSGDQERIVRFVKTVRAWSLVASLLGILVCIVASPLLNRYMFDGESHTLEIMALAPVVAMTTFAGGETAILKGARRLRELARIQVVMVAALLVISVPLYYLFGVGGIIPVLLLTALANLVLTMRCSCRLYPLRLRGASGLLGEGMGMVRLGIAFVMSGIFGSGAEMVVRSFLNTAADLGTVGLYNAGYMLTVTYAGMVFSAMETDYFPRLAAVNHDTAAVNLAVNRQIEVSLLIIAPMLAFMLLALPVLIPLLFSGKFAPVVGMAQVAVLAMYARAMMLPVAYVTLAKGHSRAYLVIEGVSAVVLTLLVITCFDRWGLWGTGLAVTLSNVADLLIILVYARMRYRYVPSRQVVAAASVLLPLGLLAYFSTCCGAVWLRVGGGLLAAAASLVVSLAVLSRKTSLKQKLKNRLRRK